MKLKKSYSSKRSAVRAMWRYYNQEHRDTGGNPLIGDEGTTLQWCGNGRTSYLTVTEWNDERWLVIDSHDER